MEDSSSDDRHHRGDREKRKKRERKQSTPNLTNTSNLGFHQKLLGFLRKDRDSNPGNSYPFTAFRVRPDRPLRHLSRSIFSDCGANVRVLWKKRKVKRKKEGIRFANASFYLSLNRELFEITVVKSFEAFAMACFIFAHFMNCVMNSVKILLFGKSSDAFFVFASTLFSFHTFF